MKQLPREPTYHIEATRVLDLIESDFGQSGADVRHEAIRCELVSAYRHGLAAAKAIRELKD